MVVSVLSSLIIWGAVLVIAVRVLSKSGLKLKSNKFTDVILADKGLHSSHESTPKEIWAVFALAIAFRLGVFLFSVCEIYMFNDNVTGFGGILDQYMKWDANNYVRIATGGYKYFTVDGQYTTLAFFPLYPWLMKLVNIIFHNMQLSGLILSFVLYAGACAFLYRLFCIDYSKAASLRAIVFISVFPHSLFFGTLMNESMLLFTMSASLYYIRKHNWILTGVFGALAAMSRMAGILLAISAAVEWLEHYRIIEKLRNKNIKEVWKLFYSKGLWIFLMLAGTGIYLLCNYKVTGNCFKFLEYQETIWNNGSEYFGKCISQIFSKALSEHGSIRFEIWIPEAVSVIFAVTLLLYGLRRGRGMYTSFLAVYIIINAGFKWPISVARYMSCAVPAFVFLADFSERHKWSEYLITASMAVGMGIYLTAYLCFKQIL